MITSYAETLEVDNDPVSLSLSTEDGVNPTVWVNHPVTIDATATAGPSGVAGTNCSVDNATARSYTSQGVTVNGDGVHTITCTTWNNAVDTQGQPNTATSSLPVHIDEAPPQISFEPENPRDLTGLSVDATDSESGVASGAVEMAPVGTNNWTAVRSSFNGSQLAAHFDDSQHIGPYQFRATACDNMGNCASTTKQLTLPLRAAADQEVSLTKIINPVHRRVVVKRVLVGWHWATIRRA